MVYPSVDLDRANVLVHRYFSLLEGTSYHGDIFPTSFEEQFLSAI
jgi:hypothetical protein